MNTESSTRIKNGLKTTGRILVILLVVGLVAGGLYWIGQNRPSLLGLSYNRIGFTEEGIRPGRGAHEIFDREDISENQAPLDFDRLELRHHTGEGGLDTGRAWSGILRNILIIAAITLLVVGIQKLYAWLFRQRRQAKAV